MDDGPPLTVVVPTRDRPALLAGCLDALLRALGDRDELVVVDSASRRPGAAAAATDRGDRIRVLRCGRPGASRARNAGWRSATHAVVAFVDDDVRVAPRWADGLRAAFAAHPSASFVVGRVDVPPGSGPVERPVALRTGDEPEGLDVRTRGTIGHAANLAVRRTALVEVGGFDERLGAGAPFRAAEDNDLFDRLFAAGRRGRYEPAALAWHEQWRTRRQLLALDWSYGVGTGVRIRKLLTSDRHRAAGVAGEWLWEYGASRLGHAVRHRYEFELAVVAARVGGTVAGLAAGATHRVVDGHLISRW